MCTSAIAMLKVPSVTMNAGRRTLVTNKPLTRPKMAQERTPRRIARSAGTPLCTASFVITIIPNAITAPHDRSMPAVRMIRVCPIASTPTSTVCWRISERFGPWRNWSDCSEKKIIASARAPSGPEIELRATARPALSTRSSGPLLMSVVVPISKVAILIVKGRRRGGQARPGAWNARLLPPAVGESEGEALRGHACDWLRSDQIDAGVRVAGHLLACLGIRDDRLDAARRHLQRVLLRRRGDHACLDVANTRAAAVDRDDGHLAGLARVLQCGV